MEIKMDETICECGCFKYYHYHYGMDGTAHLMNCNKCGCKKFKAKEKTESEKAQEG